jgi:hypothetical protein
MSLAAAPDDVPADDAVALVDTSDVASGRGLLVVVAEPGTELAYSPGVTIDATASGVREWTALDAADGVAATEAPVPGGWPAEAQVRLLQDGDVVGSVRPVISERTLFMATPAVAVEDPRGLRGVVDDSLVRTAADSILGQYGVPFDQVQPVLLAAGRLTDAGATEVALVGTTLPSGATVAWMVTLSSDGTGTGGSATPTIAGPAGTALLDRVFAVPVLGSLVVSAPAAGSSVEVLDGEGRSVAAFPLVSGGGTGPAPDTAASVRVLSADEQVVATAPLTRLAE